MLTHTELAELARRHDGVKSLTAYIAIPPATPAGAVRTLLRHAITRVRDAQSFATHVERATFDACADRLQALADRAAQPSAAGSTWFGVASEGGATYDGWLAKVVPTSVGWENRVRIAPYLASLTQRPTLVVVVDRRTATIYNCVEGELVEAERVDTSPKVVTGAHTGAPPRQGFHRGTGGLPGADSAARQMEAAAIRHEARVADRIRVLARDGEWVVVLGAAEVVSHLSRELGSELGERLDAVGTGTALATTAQVRAAAVEAVARLRASYEQRVVADIVERAAAAGRGTLGRESVLAALRDMAIRSLVLSTARLADDLETTERMVRDALDQHARVEFVNGEAGDELQKLAGGVGAELRYVPATAFAVEEGARP